MNKDKQDTVLFYNKYWKSWNDVYDGHFDSTLNTSFDITRRRSIILQLIDEYPRNNTLRVIDVGCGNGYMSKEFSQLVGQSGKVFAIDRSKEAIEELKKEIMVTNIEPMEADITNKTPIADKSIDLIYLSTVFHIFSKEQIAHFQKVSRPFP